MDLSDDDLAQGVEALARFCALGKTLFPEPYGETWGPGPEGYGDRSMRDHLGTLQLSPQVRDWVEAMCCLVALGPLDQSATTEFFRTYALSGWSVEQALAALTATKLVKGTRELIGSIAEQARLADIRLNTPVLRVTQTDGEARLELANGDTISAPVGLIALPINVLNSAEFDPPLSETKRTASTERHAGAGMKCFVRVKGDIGNVSVMAPEAHALNWAVTYRHGAEGTWLIAFASNPDKLPMAGFDDVAGLQEALQPLLPDVEVEQIVGWDWVNDPLALGTWCIYRPGQLAQVLPDLRTTEGRLFFAGADSAIAWRSFIDGAIQSGYRAARDIDEYLGAGKGQAPATAGPTVPHRRTAAIRKPAAQPPATSFLEESWQTPPNTGAPPWPQGHGNRSSSTTGKPAKSTGCAGREKPLQRRGLWRIGPDNGAHFPYNVHGSDTFQIIEGEAELETPDGEKIKLTPGGLYSFPDGLTAIWRTKSPFVKFFVVA